MSNHQNRNWRSRLRAEAAALGPDLVHAWETITRQHGTLTEGLSLLNVATAGSHSLARLGEWRRGDRPVPGAVQQHMRWIVLGKLLGDLRTAAAVALVISAPNHEHKEDS